MTTEINYRLAGPAKPVILVLTYVNGRGPYEFALDTGAALSVLSADVAKTCAVESGAARHAMGAGGAVALTVSSVESLAIGDEKVEHLQVAIIDLSALSQAAGLKIEGILGYNFLKNFTITIDYPRRILRLE